MRINKNESMVFLAYIAVCIIWGSTYLAMRIAVSQFPPELFAGIRFALAGAIVLIFSVLKKYAFPGTFKDFIKAAIPGIFMLAGANGLVMFAEQWVHSGITSIILSTTPLFIALIELVIFRENKLGVIGFLLLILGFTGTTLLIAAGQGVGATDIKGGLMVLTASLLWALGTIYSQRVKCSGHLVTNIGIQMLSAGVVLILIGMAMGELNKVQINSNVVMAMVYLVVFGSIIGYSSNMFVLSRWPASIAITSAYINPIVAVLLGVILLNEAINQTSIVFMILTLGSVIGVHFRKNKLGLKSVKLE